MSLTKGSDERSPLLSGDLYSSSAGPSTSTYSPQNGVLTNNCMELNSFD